jgi:hypothetical protein
MMDDALGPSKKHQLSLSLPVGKVGNPISRLVITQQNGKPNGHKIRDAAQITTNDSIEEAEQLRCVSFQKYRI